MSRKKRFTDSAVHVSSFKSGKERRPGSEPAPQKDAHLCYRNPEGYPDPTAFLALRNVIRKTRRQQEPSRPRTQVVHYD